MHYKNGREAKQGDCILNPNGIYSKIGVLVNLQPGNTACNGNLVTMTGAYPDTITVGDCWHLDDVLELLNAALMQKPAAA